MAFNWLIFALIVILQNIIGALWYSLIFGKQWLTINHPEGLPSKEEITKAGKEAVPLFGIQLLLTIVGASMQWHFVAMNPNNWLQTSLLIWIGFLVPSLIQIVIWSDPKNEKKLLQIGIVALNTLINVILAGFLFTSFK